ncbi:MAG: fimbrillin family protein [Alistipes sp.]|nr:fimbrillin family protein [Alistipes sp.]
MKKLFLMLAAAAAVASCSKDYTIVADQGEAIEFGSFVENSTRATEATDPSYTAASLAYFDVYGAVRGVNIFDGDRVTRGTLALGEAWSMDYSTAPKQYWIAGAPYTFAAVVDATSVTTDTNTGLPTVLSYTTSTQKDMLYDYVATTGKPNEAGIVGFEFTHLLSKVKFSVKNTTDAGATNYRIVLTEAKLTNVYPSGTYAVNGDTGTWTPATASEYVLENLTVNSNSTQYNSDEVLLIPGSAVGVYVLADVQATANGTDWTTVSTMEKTFTNVLGKTGETPNVLAANQAYHFAVSLGIGEEIKFTATALPDWADGDGADDTPLQ